MFSSLKDTKSIVNHYRNLSKKSIYDYMMRLLKKNIENVDCQFAQKRILGAPLNLDDKSSRTLIKILTHYPRE